MADDDPVFCFDKAHVKRTHVQNIYDLKVYRRFKRNRLRLLRRKRSKLRYRARRKAERIIRKTEDLCSVISVCNITDNKMHCDQPPIQPTCDPLLPEVANWQNQHQVAYWKSRALAVEYENRMLHKLLRDMQLQQIENYVKGQNKELTERPKQDFQQVSSSKKYNNREGQSQEYYPPPTDQARREKQERMTELYGSKAAKIGGMETALELSYQLYMEQHNPSFWPSIPMRL